MHPWKTFSSFIIIEEGIVILLRDEHPSKVRSIISITEEGIEILISEEHWKNTPIPIIVKNGGTNFNGFLKKFLK
mgnify:CR=1 FL=1